MNEKKYILVKNGKAALFGSFEECVAVIRREFDYPFKEIHGRSKMLANEYQIFNVEYGSDGSPFCSTPETQCFYPAVDTHFPF